MEPKQEVGTRLSDDELTIIFVLGDAVQAHKYDQFCHLSVGDLLRLDGRKKFLTDGFLTVKKIELHFWSDYTISSCELDFICQLKLKFVLHLSFSLEVMVQRLLRREQETSLPVVEYYRSVGMLQE
ncbi:hypothetical protein MKW98_017931, partial [Papaver atlanticum]